jgi:hypothetical protein
MMWFLLVILVAAVVALGIVVIDRRRTAELRQHFGPEYERAVDEHGARRAAESDLRRRLERRRDAEVRDLSPEARERLCARWRVVQAGFVDDPQASVAEAAGLVEEAMAERGYLRDGARERRDGVAGDGVAVADDGDGARPGDGVGAHDGTGAFDGDRADDGDRPPHDDRVGPGEPDRHDRYELVAVDHPVLVERFRSAPHVGAGGDGLGDAPALTADELRALFLQHHELFEALVGDSRAPRASRLEEARS